MTQAFNLSQFANKVNTSGQADLTTAVTGLLPVANGGTGTATPSLVGGTNITISGSFPNQTVTAASGAPTTAQVLSATAGASAGDVGTYAIGALQNQASNITVGTNYAGSSVLLMGIRGSYNLWTDAGLSGSQGSTTQSGTWKILNSINYSGNVSRAGLFLRIS